MQKLEKTAKSWAITAHRLTDGTVVYWADTRGWDESVDNACVYTERDKADTALGDAQKDIAAQKVIGVYLFEVAPDTDSASPASVREQIRAKGPTVRPDLGKQAAV